MTLFEILNFNKELIERLRLSGAKLEDARFLDLFADFNKMVAKGDKVSYAVAVLADQYSISERKVYSLIKRFKTDCKFGSA